MSKPDIDQPRTPEPDTTLEQPGTDTSTDWDAWTQHENLSVKALLDREFPLEGNTAQALVQGAAAVGDAWQVQTAADSWKIYGFPKGFVGTACRGGSGER